jgi:FtsH-binding integral membrane protein
MSFVDDSNNPYRASAWGDIAAHAAVDERADFIRKTYAHLLGAVFAFAALEAVLLNTVAPQFVNWLASTGQYAWLFILGGMIFVSYIADRWARSNTSQSLQYAGLSLYVVAEAVLFMPLLYMASQMEIVSGQSIIATAGIITLILFGGLTAVVWMTGANFDWMRNLLFVAGIAAFGAILCSILFGFSLGIWFSAAMILFACGWILYDTSAVMHNYRVGQHVAASLGLFASVMLLFWYVVRFVMQFTSND